MTEAFDRWAIKKFDIGPGAARPVYLSEIHRHISVFVQEVERRAWSMAGSGGLIHGDKELALRDIVRDFGLEEAGDETKREGD